VRAGGAHGRCGRAERTDGAGYRRGVAADPRYESVAGLAVTLDGSVLRCTFERPEVRNALDDTMVAGLIRALETVGTDERARVVVLRGAGGTFCAGADLVARNAPDGPRPRAGSIQRRLPVQVNRLMTLLCTVQTPVVAEVEGAAVGLGFHLALAADFCVADAAAEFWEPFVARGFTPDSGGSWLLPRLVGAARARELVLLGRRITGAEASGLGLVHRAVPAAELTTTTDALVAELAAGPTVALGLAKWLLFQGAAVPFEQQLANEAFALELSARSEDFREGLAAWRERRPPDFTGR
jgi:2-(1,2-epoxy-1,2-dihydrophenyl)acetyl-CoA isomerase